MFIKNRRRISEVGPDKVEGKTRVFTESFEADFPLEELLNRKAITVDKDPLKKMFQGKTVLITGAGGSIGSELSRQIAMIKPEKVIILDHSELNLFNIDSELREMDLQISIETLLMDIKDYQSLERIFKVYRPQMVFHAAAYKHVHLVENNPFTSIINNVVGTKNLVDLSLLNEVSTFVLVSTDKAVNPTSIMGASKRICELIVTEAARESQKRFCAVRFGNVLGSSGSLIPLLKSQIKKGGPVTITDKDMTRYFMMIPEAVSLILKSAEISRPGDINVLRMGEPVRILDLARKVIHLMGKTEEEIPIVFIGKRPGEKLYEELYLCGNELQTEHSDILVLPNGDGLRLSFKENASVVVNRLITHCLNHDPKGLKFLIEIVKADSRIELSEVV